MDLSYLVLFALALVGALIFTPAVRWFGFRYRVLDPPGERKIHRVAVPRLGGVAVFLAVVVSVTVSLIGGLFSSAIHPFSEGPFWGLSIGCLLVLGVGVLDDIRRLPPWPKLLVEILAALTAYAFGLRIELLTIPFGLAWNVSWLSAPLTVLWLVGITNAINLADGIDGLAAGIATFAGGILFLMTLSTVYTWVPYLAAAVTGACLGFLRYNFSPATIFLGDSGSLFLGFFLGGLSLWASEKSTIAFALLIPIVALGIPIMDVIYTVLRRWHRGLPFGQADRDHIHHRLLEKGFSHRKTVLLLYSVNTFLAALAGLMLFTRNSIAAYLIVFLGVGLVLVSRFLGYFHFSTFFTRLVRNWRESRKRKFLDFRLRVLLRSYGKVKDLHTRWELLSELFLLAGVGRAVLNLSPFPNRPLVWNGILPEDSTRLSTRVTLPLQEDQGVAGTLELYWYHPDLGYPPGMHRFLNVLRKEFLHQSDLGGFSPCTDPSQPSLPD